MRFRYPRLQFIIRFFLLSILLAAIFFLLWVPGVDSAWLSGFFIVFLIAIALTTLTPAMTSHEVIDDGVILRQGLLFRAFFPFGDIESAQRNEIRLWAFGLFPSGARGRIILASGNRNLVSFKLKARKRFGALLWRSSDEIIIDLENPTEFLKMVNEKLTD